MTDEAKDPTAELDEDRDPGDGGEREVTLDEYVERLPESHPARTKYIALRDGTQATLELSQREATRARELEALIDATGRHWLELEPGIPWEGGIDKAMEAAVAEIRRLRERPAEVTVDGTVEITEGDSLLPLELDDGQRLTVEAIAGGDWPPATLVLGHRTAAGDNFSIGYERPGHVLTASEALFGFLGWLTTREEELRVGSHCNVPPALELLERYRIHNGLPEPREGWEKRQSAPPEPETPAPAVRAGWYVIWTAQARQGPVHGKRGPWTTQDEAVEAIPKVQREAPYANCDVHCQVVEVFWDEEVKAWSERVSDPLS